jgi:hypothetical protein
MLTEYCPICRQMKANCKCKRLASIQQENIGKPNVQPIEGDEKIYYIAQGRPWQQRQGMPPNPLSFNPSFPSSNQKISAQNT